ncbi:MAG: glycosyltransferase family 2 protein [Hydrococcus sp. SU_1_0]|nr:glycosyltransferase family 2 protein [Hydrococcus sp. SU_1_0]
MNHQPLVSVIMIFFNEEKFIEEAIASVLAQTYEHWELLLVDDGSSDRSTKIAQSYAEKYPQKIHYLEHENHQNRGMSATRNLGISKAQGEYLAFLDGDDVYLPHKLEQQIYIMESYPETAMVYGHTQDWYGWTGKPEDMKHDLIYDLGVPTNNVIQPPILFNLCLQRQAPTPCTCSALFRRDMIEDVGDFEESFRGLYEDQVFFLKILLKKPVFVAGEFWDKYRRHPESCYSTAKRTGQNHSLRLVFFKLAETISKRSRDSRSPSLASP